MTTDERNAIVEAYLPFIRAVVRRVPVPFDSVDLQELEAEGAIGFMAALERYQPTGISSLKTYAYPRIVGAVRDYLRSIDPLTRDVRCELRAADRGEVRELSPERARYIRRMEAMRARPASLDEPVAVGGRRRMAASSSDSNAVSVHELLAGSSPDPLDIALEREERETLRAAIDALPDEERAVVRLIVNGVAQRQISEMLGMYESYVWQLSKSARKRLRKTLAGSALDPAMVA